MWRLITVEHDRCNEWDGAEYFLAPPEWTKDEIKLKVRTIVEKMIEDAKAIKEGPGNPGYGPKFEDFPDLTVQKIKDNFVEKREAFKKWKEENDQLTRSFAARMEDAGFCPLWKAAEAKETESIAVAADWSHNHGLDLNYKSTDHPYYYKNPDSPH